MASKLPYMLSAGVVPKILEKIQNARRPDRFTQDFLETKLGHSGGSARPIIPLLKRMSFLGSDGIPTPLYDAFRNANTQGAAVAQGMQSAFKELFDRNEYVYELSREELIGLVVEITGGTSTDTRTKAIVSTFSVLSQLADFDADAAEAPEPTLKHEMVPTEKTPGTADDGSVPLQQGSVEMRVGYTINLNLPETTNPEVFNAIFKSLQ